MINVFLPAGAMIACLLAQMIIGNTHMISDRIRAIFSAILLIVAFISGLVTVIVVMGWM